MPRRLRRWTTASRLPHSPPRALAHPGPATTAPSIFTSDRSGSRSTRHDDTKHLIDGRDDLDDGCHDCDLVELDHRAGQRFQDLPDVADDATQEPGSAVAAG